MKFFDCIMFERETAEQLKGCTCRPALHFLLIETWTDEKVGKVNIVKPTFNKKSLEPRPECVRNLAGKEKFL